MSVLSGLRSGQVKVSFWNNKRCYYWFHLDNQSEVNLEWFKPIGTTLPPPTPPTPPAPPVGQQQQMQQGGARDGVGQYHQQHQHHEHHQQTQMMVHQQQHQLQHQHYQQEVLQPQMVQRQSLYDTVPPALVPGGTAVATTSTYGNHGICQITPQGSVPVGGIGSAPQAYAIKKRNNLNGKTHTHTTNMIPVTTEGGRCG